MYEGGEGVQGLPEAPESIEADTGDRVDDVEETSDEPETAHETVQREYERLKAEAEAEDPGDQGGDEAPGEVLVEKAGKRGRGRPKKEAAAPAEPFKIPPPNRLTVEQKEIFHQLPDNLKRAAHQMFRDHDAHYTQVVQRATAAEREARGVVEAVRPYLLSHPELQEQGYTESRIVSSLIAAHQKLTDPKTARQAYADLGEQIGLDPEIIEAIKGQQHQRQQAPQIATLPTEAQEAINWARQQKEAQSQRAVAGMLAELQAVQNEMTPDGRYVFPKLHDPVFIQQWKPLVSDLARTLPYQEAAKRAYWALEGYPGNSSPVNQARFPAQNTQLERAQQAAVSVRGKSAPSAAGSYDIPDEALGSPLDSARWAYNQLTRGAGR